MNVYPCSHPSVPNCCCFNLTYESYFLIWVILCERHYWKRMCCNPEHFWITLENIVLITCELPETTKSAWLSYCTNVQITQILTVRALLMCCFLHAACRQAAEYFQLWQRIWSRLYPAVCYMWERTTVENIQPHYPKNWLEFMCENVLR